jgi:hypothetical protein
VLKKYHLLGEHLTISVMICQKVLALVVSQCLQQHPRINDSFCLISRTEIMRNASVCEFSHSQIACENRFDCVWGCCNPFRQDTGRKEWPFAEKLRYGSPNVSAPWPKPEFVIE